MAILQVRNLPDRVYERLKEKAEENRRSITREAIVLLEQALGCDTSGRDDRNRMIDALLETDIASALHREADLPGPAEMMDRMRRLREKTS